MRALLGKRVYDVLRAKKVGKKLPEDLLSLIQRHVVVMKHFEMNKRDRTAQRGVTLVESKIQRLAGYYRSRKMLPVGWAYDRTQAKLYLE